MPIMALFRTASVDRSQYDAIISDLDLERNPPEGSISHVAGFDGDGVCVMDVWESREAFERFVAERLQPTFARLKLDIDPPRVMEAYAVKASDAIDRFKPALVAA